MVYPDCRVAVCVQSEGVLPTSIDKDKSTPDNKAIGALAHRIEQRLLISEVNMCCVQGHVALSCRHTHGRLEVNLTLRPVHIHIETSARLHARIQGRFAPMLPPPALLRLLVRPIHPTRLDPPCLPLVPTMPLIIRILPCPDVIVHIVFRRTMRPAPLITGLPVDVAGGIPIAVVGSRGLERLPPPRHGSLQRTLEVPLRTLQGRCCIPADTLRRRLELGADPGELARDVRRHAMLESMDR
mmetsp:Transcript_28096/g.91101  ORF Transcript_28096/g.91101 Transcript_28096/m.91101 type:complete len:241 (-) Transcript_28096:332-1054(-)